MEESQRQLLQQQQNQQNHHYQQFLLLQQLQKQQHHAAGVGGSSFPTNIDGANLRPQGLRPFNFHPNPNSNLQQQQHQQIPNLFQQNQQPPPQQQQQNANMQLQQNPNMQQEKSVVTAIRPVNQAEELQMAYQDAWRICNPDMRRPFSSLQDACERLLPYHVIADYEAEEDDQLLKSDSTGQVLSRSQQWDQNIATKVAEFTHTFEKQVQAFNLITHKRTTGEFRSEERLMIEQVLLQDEKRSIHELRSEMANREAHEAGMRMAIAARREDAQAQAEMMRGPIRASAFGSQGNNNVLMSHEMAGQGQGGNNHDDDAMMMNGWGNNGERELPDNFLNDEENENGDDEWRDSGDFDLNRR